MLYEVITILALVHVVHEYSPDKNLASFKPIITFQTKIYVLDPGSARENAGRRAFRTTLAKGATSRLKREAYTASRRIPPLAHYLTLPDSFPLEEQIKTLKDDELLDFWEETQHLEHLLQDDEQQAELV